jgi:hypothetical protein
VFPQLQVTIGDDVIVYLASPQETLCLPLVGCTTTGGEDRFLLRISFIQEMTKASSNHPRYIKLAYLWHLAPSTITADLGKLKTAACRRQAAGGTLATSTVLEHTNPFKLHQSYNYASS